MRGSVFISYRREDIAGHAGRLYDRLKTSFSGRVFMDLGEIRPGADFVEAIEQHLGRCAALVALIGSNWAANGRLRDPADFVRLEIADALKRGIVVVPVLVGGARLPATPSLPEDLQPVPRRQTISISDEDWDGSCERLVRALEGVLGPARRKAPAARWWGIGLAAVVLAAVVGFSFWKIHNVSTLANGTATSGVTLPKTTREGKDYDNRTATATMTAQPTGGADQVGGAKSPAPVITSISPKDSGCPNWPTAIDGINFGKNQGTSTVKFGSAPAEVTSWTPSSITVNVPPIASGSTEVSVTVQGVGSARKAFFVDDCPAITLLSPKIVSAGDVMTVIGVNFGAPKEGSYLSFVSHDGRDYPLEHRRHGGYIKSWSDTSIDVEIPRFLEPGAWRLQLSVGNTVSSEVDFTIRKP